MTRWAIVPATLVILSACGGGDGTPDSGAADDAEDAALDDGPGEADAAPEEASPDDAESDGGDAEAEADVPAEPGPEFERYCRGAAWDAALEPATLWDLDGDYAGAIEDTPAGTLEGVKIVPSHPFRVRTIRVAFTGRSGTARLRLMKTMGHSYPADWPRLDSGDGNLMPPLDVEVTAPDPDTWLEVDVSDRFIFLLPRESYIIVYEHLDTNPHLAIQELLPGQSQWGTFVPTVGDGGGLGDGNFRMQVVGDEFCRWSDADRWFERSATFPDPETSPQQLAVAEVDGDDLDDLVMTVGGRAQVWPGRGDGTFSDAPYNLFPEAPSANLVVFGDLDNDGDRDAVVATYVNWDGDGDGVNEQDGDCNDADAAIHRGAAEVPGNGLDDDCNGVADDGADTADRDGDGVTIAAGDCDDTRTTVRPGAAELNDQLDNDCDGEVDEDHVTTVQLNDGTGHYTRMPSPDLERRDTTSAAAFGDGDRDGFLDVYVGNWWAHYPTGPAVPDHYLEGQGDGTFLDATSAAGMARAVPAPCYGVRFTDVNDDGWPDVWVGNYGGNFNFLFQNRGTGSFLEVGDSLGYAQDRFGPMAGTTFGGDFGDLDNDGDLDFVECDISHPRYGMSSDQSRILVNLGAPRWNTETHRDDFGFHWDEGDINAALADFDNDTVLDLAVASVYSGHFARLYRGLGGGTLDDVTYEAGVVVQLTGRLLWSDVDRDGDQDLIYGDGDGAPWTHLFVNRIGQDQAWVELLLEGTASNRDAIGARVMLEAGGVRQRRDVEGGGGHWNIQESLVAHFGLGDATAIESLTVRWPNGTTEMITGAAPRGRYRIVEGSGTAVELP
ncbi:MAG: VCBS repeat-containing protein [Deltaproteobacteria bacterium]|nr:VCBS repeat-containing protein [Deltaproteobacteria bacterium]